MKNTSALSAALLALIPVTALADSGAYLGAGYGEASYEGSVELNKLIQQSFSEIPVSPIDEGRPIRSADPLVKGDDSDSAWKIFGGYNFNRYIALEMSYADLGSANTSVWVPGIEAISSAGEGEEGVYRGTQRTDLSYETQVFALSARGTVPIGSWFRLFGKLGATYYDSETKRKWGTAANKTVPGEETVDASATSPTFKKSESGTSWLYGVGVGFNLGENWGIDLEYESYQDIELGEFVKKDSIDMWSASIQYRF